MAGWGDTVLTTDPDKPVGDVQISPDVLVVDENHDRHALTAEGQTGGLVAGRPLGPLPSLVRSLIEESSLNRAESK